MEKVILLLSL